MRAGVNGHKEDVFMLTAVQTNMIMKKYHL